jgi:serine/threonine-protein kinase
VDSYSKLAITPDGTRIVYTGNSGTQLFERRLDELESRVILTGVVPLNSVFFSPDGQWIGFVEGGRVKKVALTGGPVTEIARTGTGSLGATWAPDDTIIIASPDAPGLRRVSAAGGKVTELTQPDKARGELNHQWPQMLPGGRAVLYTIAATTGGPNAAQVAVLDLATMKSTVLVRGGSQAQYVSSGHLIYTVGSTLAAVPFDLDRLQTRGTGVQVVPRLATVFGNSFVSVSAGGTLAYVDAPTVGPPQNTLVWVDRQDREEPVGALPGPYSFPRLSPDGTRVIAWANEEMFVWDLVRGQTTRFAAGFFPVWMNNRDVAFFGSGAIFRQRADGTGNAEALSDGMPGNGMLPSSVTPDGTRILFSIGGRDQMALALDGTRRVEALIQTPANERNGIVSPNGRWLAYESDVSERFEIYVLPYPNVNSAQPRRISSAGGIRPLWAHNGRELFYVALAPDNSVMAVPVNERDASLSPGSPVKVVDGPYVTRGNFSGRNYDVSPDGQRFLMIKQPPFDPATAPQIVIRQNWFEELKRLVP